MWPVTKLFKGLSNLSWVRGQWFADAWHLHGRWEGTELTTVTTDLAGSSVLQGEVAEGLEEGGAGIHVADILNLDLELSRVMSHILPPERNKVLAITGGYHIIRIQGGSKCSPSSLTASR